MKKNFQTNLFVGVFLLVATSFNSCSKENQLEIQDEKYLEFANLEDYNNTVTKVLSMNEEERLLWEKQQGFTSFASICTEKYRELAAKELPMKEVQAEVEKNKDFLELKSEVNGEFTLENKLESTPKRFIINKNQIFKIGNTFYKVFENDVIITDKKNLSKLLTLNETNYKSSISKEIKYMIDTKELKNGVHSTIPMNLYTETGVFNDDMHAVVERRAESGRNRTRVRMYIDFTRNLSYQSYMVKYDAKAYVRTLGVWYEAKRTISCQFQALLHHNPSGNEWLSFKTPYNSNPGTNTYEINNSFIVPNGEAPLANINQSWIHFAAIKCWADSPDTGKAEIIYNAELL